VYDDDQLPDCAICQHPASQLFPEGIFLCATHAAEARSLDATADVIEWSLTEAGTAALADARLALRSA
jgi:hypothetical protein